MKHPADKFTVDAFTKSGPGRPRKPDAKCAAQRMREYRKRKKCNALISVTALRKLP